MSELAFNSEGCPIDVPPSAVAWQVRRIEGRGRPHAVYTADGLPLFLPIEAGIEDVRRAVEIEGRYQLVFVDEHHRRIDGAEWAYVWLRPRPTVDESGPALARPAGQDLLALARTSIDMAQAMLAQAVLLLDIGSALLRAAQDTESANTAIRDLMR